MKRKFAVVEKGWVTGRAGILEEKIEAMTKEAALRVFVAAPENQDKIVRFLRKHVEVLEEVDRG